MIDRILTALENVKIYYEFGMSLPEAVIEFFKEVYYG